MDAIATGKGHDVALGEGVGAGLDRDRGTAFRRAVHRVFGRRGRTSGMTRPEGVFVEVKASRAAGHALTILLSNRGAVVVQALDCRNKFRVGARVEVAHAGIRGGQSVGQLGTRAGNGVEVERAREGAGAGLLIDLLVGVADHVVFDFSRKSAHGRLDVPVGEAVDVERQFRGGKREIDTLLRADRQRGVILDAALHVDGLAGVQGFQQGQFVAVDAHREYIRRGAFFG